MECPLGYVILVEGEVNLSSQHEFAGGTGFSAHDIDFDDYHIGKVIDSITLSCLGPKYEVHSAFVVPLILMYR